MNKSENPADKKYKNVNINIFVLQPTLFKSIYMAVYLEFEEPIKELEQELEKARSIAEKSKVDVSGTVKALETKIKETR